MSCDSGSDTVMGTGGGGRGDGSGMGVQSFRGLVASAIGFSFCYLLLGRWRLQ